jgi:hypothetical protein
MSAPPTRERRAPHPNSLANLKKWQPGESGNPAGRARIEPRIRRRARRFDTRLVRELWKIGSDPKVDPDVRRRCLMDLQSIGNGRPPTTQELVGRPDAPLGPLVNLNFAVQPGQPLAPDQCYMAMVSGHIPIDPSVFSPAIEAPHTSEPNAENP